MEKILKNKAFTLFAYMNADNRRAATLDLLRF